MAGSTAEERIRAKAEAMLRRLWPEARIIHELMMRQGGRRADLAAVTADRLICLEIKSERDVLTRLPDQIDAMTRVADAWGVVVAPKHLEKTREVVYLGFSRVAEEDKLDYLAQHLWRSAHTGLCNAPARLDMLWADELRAIRSPGRQAPRGSCIAAATDTLTGSEVRRAVCAALRQRKFSRADPIFRAAVGGAAVTVA